MRSISIAFAKDQPVLSMRFLKSVFALPYVPSLNPLLQQFTAFET